MKVAYDSRSLSDNIAGIGCYHKYLIDHIKDKDETAILLLCSNKVIKYKESTNIKKVITKNYIMRFNSNIWFQFALPYILKKNKVDLFHGITFLQPMFINVPSVVTVYDTVLKLYPETMHWKNSLIQRALLRTSLLRSFRIIAISENTKRDIIKYFGVEQEKIKVIYLGAGKEFSPQKNEKDKTILDKYNLSPGYILTVGTLEPRKNLIRLLNAYKMLVANEDSMPNLVMVGGRGWLKEDINKIVDSLGLREKVVFTGYIPDSDLPALYRNAGVFVYPSLYEGFGLPPLEAMACGTPVVASNTSSIPEVVGDAGLLADPYNPAEIARAIAFVLKDNDLSARLERAGLIRSGMFTWDKTAQETIKLYREVIEENNLRKRR